MSQDSIKQATDWAAGGITLATVVGWMPSVAAFVTAVYTLFRLVETRLFQKVLRIVCAKCAAWWEG